MADDAKSKACEVAQKALIAVHAVVVDDVWLACMYTRLDDNERAEYDKEVSAQPGSKAPPSIADAKASIITSVESATAAIEGVRCWADDVDAHESEQWSAKTDEVLKSIASLARDNDEVEDGFTWNYVYNNILPLTGKLARLRKILGTIAEYSADELRNTWSAIHACSDVLCLAEDILRECQSFFSMPLSEPARERSNPKHLEAAWRSTEDNWSDLGKRLNDLAPVIDDLPDSIRGEIKRLSMGYSDASSVGNATQRMGWLIDNRFGGGIQGLHDAIEQKPVTSGNTIVRLLPDLPAIQTPVTTATLAVSNPPDGIAISEAVPMPGIKVSLDSRAVAYLIDNMKATHAQVAAALGCNEKSLTAARCPNYFATRARLRISDRPIGGTKDSDGNLEAWNEG